MVEDRTTHMMSDSHMKALHNAIRTMQRLVSNVSIVQKARLFPSSQRIERLMDDGANKISVTSTGVAECIQHFDRLSWDLTRSIIF